MRLVATIAIADGQPVLSVASAETFMETLEEQAKILFDKGPTRISPFTVPRLMVNAASGNVSILYNLRGPTTAVATACAAPWSATDAASPT